MTFLEAVNFVLLRLRQSTVSGWDANDYSKLIGQFVNEAKREVEDAHEWHALRTYALSALIGSGSETAEFSGTNQRTRIIQIFNNTNDTPMHALPRNEIVRRRNIGTTTTARPDFYSMSGFDNQGRVRIELWPSSDDSYVITMDAIVPQDDLDNNNTMITVPPDPVKLRALALALAERGDDGGQPYTQAMREYDIALTDAVSRDKDNGPYHEAWIVV